MSGRSDNPQFEYVMATAVEEPDFMYFDEPKEEPEYGDARVILSTLIDASKGNTTKLQALMCLFAGLTLRQAAVQCGMSHEWVRLQLESIKDTHAQLYTQLTNSATEVTALVPLGKDKKWVASRNGKTIYFSNLRRFCRVNKYRYKAVMWAVDSEQTYDDWIIQRNY